MKRLLALGILFLAIGCTPEHKENDMNGHDHHGHHHGQHQAGDAHRHGPEAGA